MYDEHENESKSKKLKNGVQPEKKTKHLIFGIFSIPIESS
jgi:hypothetical protein